MSGSGSAKKTVVSRKSIECLSKMFNLYRGVVFIEDGNKLEELTLAMFPSSDNVIQISKIEDGL